MGRMDHDAERHSRCNQYGSASYAYVNKSVHGGHPMRAVTQAPLAGSHQTVPNQPQRAVPPFGLRVVVVSVGPVRVRNPQFGKPFLRSPKAWGGLSRVRSRLGLARRGKLVSVTTDDIAGLNHLAWADEDHVCGSCRLSYAEIPVGDAVQAIRLLPARLSAALDTVPPGARRRRPDPSTWSAAEYACHIRDVLISTTVRLHRGRTENAPSVDPMFNDLRAGLFGYNQANLTAVVEETAAAAAGLCTEISRMTGPNWERVVLRRPGEQRTTRWLVRQAMHEGIHHLADIAAVRASLA